MRGVHRRRCRASSTRPLPPGRPLADHETYGTQGGNKFLQFAARFSSYAGGVGNSSGSGSQLWFSFNVGQIHFLFFCTENVAAPLSAEQPGGRRGTQVMR